jgi:nicotinamide-nucleotide amidase
MIVEIISTGAELMHGRWADSNFVYLAQRLTQLGHDVRYHATYGDDRGDLERGLKLALARAELVIMTGGLGPTDDDLTRQVAAEVFHRPLVFRRELVKRRRPAINLRQAYVPRGARVIRNPLGTAPGFLIRQGPTTFAALSGVPDEMRSMFASIPLPRRAARLQTFRIFGLSEAAVDTAVAGKIPPYGITVRRGCVTVVVRGEARAFMRRKFGAHVFTEDDRELEQVAAAALAGRTLAIAESCTGGLITDRLTDVPGISRSLLETVVAYSNASKIARLGVRERTLRDHGAVSEQTAVEMARGVAERAGADVGLAVTGVAGPTGRPVGLVWIALWNGAPRERRLDLRGDRRRIKMLAAAHALDLLRLS